MSRYRVGVVVQPVTHVAANDPAVYGWMETDASSGPEARTTVHAQLSGLFPDSSVHVLEVGETPAGDAR